MEKQLQESIHKRLYDIYKNIGNKDCETYFSIKINNNTQLWVQNFMGEVYIEFQVKTDTDEYFFDNCINLNGWSYNKDNIKDLLDKINDLLAEINNSGVEEFIENHQDDFI